MDQHVPNNHAPIVELRKLAGYLLSRQHPIGRNKARVFATCGYDNGRVDDLARELRRIVADEPVVECVESTYGSKYIVDGRIACSGGGSLAIRTIWIVEGNAASPRFVTAYPN